VETDALWWSLALNPNRKGGACRDLFVACVDLRGGDNWAAAIWRGLGAGMNWNKWFRQTHRWLSILFTVAVIINGVMVARGHYSNKMGLTAVGIMALMLITGLYLFALPYFAKRRE
jgi:hypothetical protein